MLDNSDKTISTGHLYHRSQDGESERQSIDLPADIDDPLAGWLEKRGHSTNLWVSRYYIIKNGCLYIYDSESAST